MEPTRKNLKIVNDFIIHCAKELGLKEAEINLKLLNEAQEAPSAGGFIPQTKQIICCIRNRAIADCLRTIAHELTHMKQLTVDKVDFPNDDEGMQKYEDSANQHSGRLVRYYGRKHPEIYADLG